MPKISCNLCPAAAELALHGKPVCERCAHTVVTEAAANHRRELAAVRARWAALPSLREQFGMA